MGALKYEQKQWISGLRDNIGLTNSVVWINSGLPVVATKYQVKLVWFLLCTGDAQL